MNTEELKNIIDAYFPESEHDEETLRMARLMGQDVERVTRQHAVSKAYSLAHEICKTPKQND